MNKLKYIYIKKFLGLKDIALEDLGRINVFCGKNNSGKTTVFNAINNSSFYYAVESRRNQAKKVYELIEDRHFEDGIDGEGNYFKIPFFDNDKDKAHIYNAIRQNKLLEKYLSEKKIVRTDSYRNFEQFLKKELIQLGEDETIINYISGIENLGIDDSLYRELFNIIVKREYITYLIDAKRKLNSGYSIRNRKDEKNLLKYIFYLKNSHSLKNKRRLKKLKDKYLEITGGFNFVISTDEKFNLSLEFVTPSGDQYSAENCGLGLRDLLLLLSYSILLDDDIILLIEEPENHLHPDLQRKFLNFISTQNKKQFFISTHSNVFLDTKFVDKVFRVAYENNIISVDNTTTKANLLNDLGYSVSDNLLADMVILVEGPSDKMVLEQFITMYGLYAKYDIKIWAMGGSIMNSHDLEVFASVYNNIEVLLDNDPEEDRVAFEDQCASLKIKITKLARYAIENYYTLDALKLVFGRKITAPKGTVIDPNIKLSKQGLGEFNPKRHSRPKEIAKKMKFSDIEKNDLGDFIIYIGEKLNKSI